MMVSVLRSRWNFKKRVEFRQEIDPSIHNFPDMRQRPQPYVEGGMTHVDCGLHCTKHGGGGEGEKGSVN